MSSGFEGLQSLLNPKEGSFLQARKNILYNSKQTTPYPNKVYVNSIMKSFTSSSSLEMCPETLGNESGSNIDPNLDEYSYLMLENKSCNIVRQRKARKCCKKSGIFPPPLSFMKGVKVEARREGDRLIINFRAERIYFKSERENGRLRLFLLKKKIDEKVEKNGEKLGCKREVGEFYGSSKKIPSLPVCVAFS